MKAWYKVISITNNQVSQFFSVAKVKFIVFWITMLPTVQKKPYAFCWTKAKFQFIKTEKNNYFDRLTTEGSKSLTLACLAYSSLVFLWRAWYNIKFEETSKIFWKTVRYSGINWFVDGRKESYLNFSRYKQDQICIYLHSFRILKTSFFDIFIEFSRFRELILDCVWFLSFLTLACP